MGQWAPANVQAVAHCDISKACEGLNIHSRIYMDRDLHQLLKVGFARFHSWTTSEHTALDMFWSRHNISKEFGSVRSTAANKDSLF